MSQTMLQNESQSTSHVIRKTGVSFEERGGTDVFLNNNEQDESFHKSVDSISLNSNKTDNEELETIPHLSEPYDCDAANNDGRPTRMIDFRTLAKGRGRPSSGSVYSTNSDDLGNVNMQFKHLEIKNMIKGRGKSKIRVLNTETYELSKEYGNSHENADESDICSENTTGTLVNMNI